MSRSPAWSYLPVDDLSVPVAGLTCLGSLERKHMTYELTGSGGFAGFRGFGVDEFAESKALNAASTAKTAAQKAALTSTFKPTTSLAIKGVANLFSGATAMKAPSTGLQTLIAPLPVTPKLMPLIGPIPVGPGMPDPAGCSPGYYRTIRGTCELPGPAFAPAEEEDNTKMYLIAGGLVVALGTAAFFMTRKGKLPVSYAMAGFRGFGAFGATFAPDCYLSSPGNKGDMLGKPITPESAAAYRLKHGPVADLVIAACNQSSDPLTCIGQNFLSSPFLGRPCQNEWKAWIQSKIISAGVPSTVATAAVTMPPMVEEPDNTLLYAGIGAVAVVGIGAVLMMRKK